MNPLTESALTEILAGSTLVWPGTPLAPMPAPPFNPYLVIRITDLLDRTQIPSPHPAA